MAAPPDGRLRHRIAEVSVSVLRVSWMGAPLASSLETTTTTISRFHSFWSGIGSRVAEAVAVTAGGLSVALDAADVGLDVASGPGVIVASDVRAGFGLDPPHAAAAIRPSAAIAGIAMRVTQVNLATARV
ncbi:MAG: hypothetical protein ACKVVT_09690 [Dehalococcoidia bacterium]